MTTKLWQIDGAAWERIFAPKAVEPRPDHREIHISDVRIFLECRRKWDYTSPLRQGWQTALPNMNLWLGRLVHEALAAWYTDKNARQTLDLFEDLCMADIDRAIERGAGAKFNDLMATTMELGIAVLRHYIIWSRRHDRFDVLDREVTGRVLLPHPARTMLVGRLDLVGVDQADKVFIMDHKTASRIPSIGDMKLDTQAITYMFLAANSPHIERPEYFMFNFLLKKEAGIPRVLQNGRLSKAKLSGTSLEMYAKAIHDHGDTWDNYPDVKLELLNRPNPFFARHKIRRTSKAINLHVTDLVAIASEMLAPVPSIYPSHDRFRCGWCEFRDACQIQSEGADPTVILHGGKFVRRKVWH